MASDLAAEGLGWLAAAAGGLCLGAAAAWAARALAARAEGRPGPSRRAVSMVFLSLSGAVATAPVLLVFPPKSMLVLPGLWIWAGVWGAAGCLSSFFPRRVGAPLAALALAALGLAAVEASAWHPLEPGREVARFVPYDTADGTARGDFSVPDRNAVPVLSSIVLTSRQCALEARVLEFSGPPAALFGPKRYRLQGLTDGAGRELLWLPRKPGLPVLRLDERDLRWAWVSVRAVRSETSALEDLTALSWAFDEAGDLAESSP